jgi:hypothetical protein
MSGETWTAASSDAETWISVEDAANGYVEALYVSPRYVHGVGSTIWAEASDASSTWSSA